MPHLKNGVASDSADGAPVSHHGAVLGARRRASGCSRSSSTPSSRRWRRTTTSGRWRCARRAAWCSTATGGAGREPPLLQHLHRPRAHQGSRTARSGCWPRCSASTRPRVREIVDRHRREPTYRPITIVAGRDAGAGGGGHGAAPRLRAARRRRRAGADAALSARRWRRTCSATSARSATRRSADERRPEERRHRRPVGHREGLQRAADGRGRRARVVVNSVGREIRDARRRRRRPKASALQLTIDYDVQKAVEDGVQASRGFNGAAVMLDPRNGEVLGVHQPCRRTTRTRSPRGIDRATWASLNTDELRPLQRPRDPGTLFAGSTFKMAVATGGARRRRHHAGLPRLLRAAARPSTAARSSAGQKGGHGTIDLRHAIEQSCDVYFYTVGNMVGVDKINKWATRSASA